jgi:hypothetical protein
MNDIQLQMCILLSREHLDELQRKQLELGQRLRKSQQTIAHSCKLLAGLDALLAAPNGNLMYDPDAEAAWRPVLRADVL